MVFNDTERSWEKTLNSEGRQASSQLDGKTKTATMFESKIFEFFLAYIAENRLKEALEAEVKYMVIEANETEVHLKGPGVDFEPESSDKIQIEAPS